VTGGHSRVFPFPVSFGRQGHSGLPLAKERIIADLNHLFAGHQTALFNAAKAGSAQDQQTWNGLAEFYAERIRRVRAAAELPIYQWA